MKDPFRQALDHRYDLERLLKTAGVKKGTWLLGHGLAFPWIRIDKLRLAAAGPREILIDRDDMGDVIGAVERVLDYHRGSEDKRSPPGEEGIDLLRDLLAPRIEIEVPLSTQFMEEEEALVLLTHDQSLLLNRLGRTPRVAVTGCAGSGKTMLAVAHGRRLARDEQRVGFICFNSGLRNYLRAAEDTEGLEFHTFHGLCVLLASKAGLDLGDYGNADEPPPEYWSDGLPEALVDAVEKLGPQFDALIIDEAQDLDDHWLDALTTTLGDASKSAIWLFMDDNQRVYDAKLEVPTGFTLWDLNVNCRNTQAIHREVMKLYEGEIVPEVKGPPGREMELIHSDDPPAAVAGVLERLCGKEGVPPQDIVVLSSHRFDKSSVAQSLPGKYRPTKERGKLGPHVFCSSIRGFKGLESPVVVLCELEDIDNMTQNQQLYVGISRARNHCAVVVPPAA